MKKFTLLTLVFAVFMINATVAPSDHPFYIKALMYLKTSKEILSSSPDKTLTSDDSKAIAKIDQAIDEINKASINGADNISKMPPMADVKNRIERLKQAMMWLDKAISTIGMDPDATFANGVKDKTTKDIQDAREIIKTSLSTAK